MPKVDLSDKLRDSSARVASEHHTQGVDKASNDHCDGLAARCPRHIDRARSRRRNHASADTPIPGESLAEAGERIREAVPIRSQTATNEECAARRAAIDATLAARAVWQQDRRWYTAQMTDGQIAGVWARSSEEAELDLTVWFGTRCHWVLADPTHAVRAEYFPQGIRRPIDSGRRFPLAPPRRPRDHFAPADSILETLGPEAWGREL